MFEYMQLISPGDNLFSVDFITRVALLIFSGLILVAAGAPESATANKDLAYSLPTANQRWSLEQLHEKLHRLDLAERQLQRNCSRTLVLETLFFDLI